MHVERPCSASFVGRVSLPVCIAIGRRVRKPVLQETISPPPSSKTNPASRASPPNCHGRTSRTTPPPLQTRPHFPRSHSPPTLHKHRSVRTAPTPLPSSRDSPTPVAFATC